MVERGRKSGRESQRKGTPPEAGPPVGDGPEKIRTDRAPRSARPRSAADDEFLRRLGRRVGSLRIQAALTREELAARSDVHDSFLRKLEAGNANPSALVLKALAEALGVKLSLLLELSLSPDAGERLPRVRKPRKELADE